MKKVFLLIILLTIIFVGGFYWKENYFLAYQLGKQAFAKIEKQLSFGPRYPGSEGHQKTIDYLEAELLNADLLVEKQVFSADFQEVEYNFTNIIGRYNPLAEKRIILGAHYDSRRFADLDPKNPSTPLIGANDSAWGTAILLTLANYLEKEKINYGVDLVFFDGEEGFPGVTKEQWFPIGSNYLVENLDQYYQENPSAVIILDMVGDKDLQLYIDNNSYRLASELTMKIWDIGHWLYPFTFIKKLKYTMIDDHTAFNEVGIPAVVIIDFDYPVFHTQKDDLSQVSVNSLGRVAQVVLKYLEGS